MAELATGAVSTLLGVISHETLRLGRVRRDVQFIQEEMESMGSFLANLSENSREHDEQVRTWMNQVRILANDCNNCIDLYLYRGDPELHLPRKGPGHYLRWTPWLLRKLLAQHRAAGQLRELKDRAEDIGNRRMRYGVEVKPPESSSSGAGQLAEPLLLSATQDHEEEDDDDHHHHQDGVDPPLNKVVTLSMTSMSMDKKDYFRRRLDHWIETVVHAGAAEKDIKSRAAGSTKPAAAGSKPLPPSIAFVVTETEDANALGDEALAVVKAYFKRAEDTQDKVVPSETKDAAHENKVVPPEIKAAGALAHKDKVVAPPETKAAGALAHEDKAAAPLETKDTGALVHEDKAIVPPEIKDFGALAHADKAVVPLPPETKDVHALSHEDKVVVPPETENVGALAHEDKVVMPPEIKDAGALRTKIRRCRWRPKALVLLCMKKKKLCHRRPRTLMPPETKDAGALAHEDKPVQPEIKGANDALAHEAKVVPPETKDDGALAHKDKVVVPPETKDARNVVVLVDVPMVHYESVSLRAHKILCYILAKLQHPTPMTKWRTYQFTRNTIGEIKKDIGKMEADRKIKDIKICTLEDGKKHLSELLQKMDKEEEDLENEIAGKALGQLLWLLIYHSTTIAAPEEDKKIKSKVAVLYDDIIKQTTKKLKWEIEAGGSSSKLENPEYEDILLKVFPRPISSTTTAANSSPGTSVDDEIREMVRGAGEMVRGVKDMLHELPNLHKYETTSEDEFFRNTEKEKKEDIITKIRKQLKIKMMVQKIKECLRGDQRILVILKVYDKYVPRWEETRNTLSLWGSECPIAGAVIVAKTTREDSKQYFDCPKLEPIEYSLVGLYLDTVLQNTSQHMNDQHSRKVLRDILCECEREPHEFCMMIFAHALYAKPKRSSAELSKLHSTLRAGATQKSLPRMMFKFSYRDLRKQYRSCLLYLAIFPQGQTITRSTLIGRWVAEGLITTKDWRWSSSVDEAEKCFDTLVARRLVCPAGIGVTGKVKSCTVDKLVYGFITKIAIKQRILETRLSRDLAHHFSIFSDVRLRSSEKIEDFFKKSSQFSKLKVLDLEGCLCFQQKNQCYLRDICRKILMLKYLSLRKTDVTRLPSEINNLHELEVLDIRDTKIPADETRNVLLRKLKRLLAGQKLKRVLASHIDSSPSSPTVFQSVQMPEKIKKMECVEVPCSAKPKNRLKRLLAGHVDSSPAEFSSVQIPEKIEKMEGVEVLSNVKPENHQDLKDIGGLNELKKLGVAINKENDLKPLLDSISDLLKQSLRFLSITLDMTIYKGPPSELILKNSPENLKSLTINGSKKGPEDLESLSVPAHSSFHSTASPNKQSLSIKESTSTHMGKLLELFTKNGKELTKVTLSCTFLSQEHLKVLAKLESLLCVKLRHNAYTERKLIFKKGEFENLRRFLVEGTNMTEIKFDNGAASKLEKIVLSSTNIVPVSGVDCLHNLEELELHHIKNKGMLHPLLHNAEHITKVTLHDTLLEQSVLKILADKPKMSCIVQLLDRTGSQRIINKDEFLNPNLPIVGKLPTSKELNGDIDPDEVKEDIKTPKVRLDCERRKPENQDQAKGNTREPDGAARCPSLWKAKGWCGRY